MAELSPEHWAEAENLFARALELPTGERPAFLQRECPNLDIRSEVASLLTFAGSEPLAAGLAIAAAAAAMALEVNPDERLIGTQLGPYRVESIAGHGGMGAVYRASRVDEFQQLVAIKLVRPAAESRNAQQRFRQERQILARLSHPNIARLLDGGSTAEGIPYLVMEFIEGEPITVWCERQGLDLEQRLRLFLPVCEGVEAANKERVIHRDLKPANILVTHEGVAKLLDFGIAKLLDTEDSDAALTATNFLAMTPEYASPEQVRGEGVTAATDVYSLGLILYEMLTGQKAQKLPEHTPDTIAQIVCHVEPTSPALLRKNLAGDLDNIIRKAIRKEPARRYPTAADLHADIVRYLQGLPVAARPETLGYSAGKFLHRNRTAVRAGTIAATCVGALLAFAYWLGEPDRPPHVLQVEQLTQTGRVDASGHIVTDGARLYFSERAGGRWSLAQIPVTGGIPTPIPVALENPSLFDISPDHSLLLAGAGNDTSVDEPLWIIPKSGQSPRRVGDVRASVAIWSRDGSQIFFVRNQSLLRVNADGTELHKIAELLDARGIREAPAPLSDKLRFFRRIDLQASNIWEISPDGTGLRSVMRGRGQGIQWPDGDFAGDWIAAGRYYLFLSRQETGFSVWSLHETHGFFSFFRNRPAQIYSTALPMLSGTPALDANRFFYAAGQERRELVRYSPARRQMLPFLPGVAGRDVGFSQGSSNDQGEVAFTTIPADTLWKSRLDGTAKVQLTPPGMRVGRPRWSPDGRYIVFTGMMAGKSTRVYAIPSQGGAAEPFGSGTDESDPSWSPDGSSVVFASEASSHPDGRRALNIMNWKTRKSEILPGSETFVYSAWSPDPRYIAATGLDAKIHLFDFQTRQWSLLASGVQLGFPFWSRDGRYVYYQDVLGGEDQPIFRIRISDRKTERLMALKQIPQSNVTGYTLSGLAPDDSPVASVIRSNSDIYALDLELP